MNWDSLVRIVTMLRAGRQVNRGSIPVRGSNLSRPQSVQTITGTYTVSFLMERGDAFPGIKAADA
jgi:hypothetical protein